MIPSIGLMDMKIKTVKEDSRDWYVTLGWGDKRPIIKMDLVLAIIINIKMI